MENNIYLELFVYEKGKAWNIPEMLVNMLTVSKESEIEDWFRNKIETKINFSTHRLYILYLDPNKKNTTKIDDLFSLIHEITGVSKSKIQGKRGKSKISFARQCFHYYFIKLEYGDEYDAANQTNNHRTTALHSIKVIENCKEVDKDWRINIIKEIDKIYFPLP